MSLREKIVSEKDGAPPLSEVCTGTSEIVFSLQKISEKRTRDRDSHLYLQGVDQHGYSVMVRVADFKPTIMFALPAQWDEEFPEDDLDEFVEQKNEPMFQDDHPEKIESARIVEKVPFIGFTNFRKDKLVELTFSNIKSLQTVRSHLKKQGFLLYHADFSMYNQFVMQTGCAFLDWFSVKEYRIPDVRSTYANVEISVNMRDLVKTEAPVAVGPMIKAFVRLKTVSRDGVVEDVPYYQPMAHNPFDRIVALTVYYSWSTQMSGAPFHKDVFTVLDSKEDDDGKTTVNHCDTEEAILFGFKRSIIAMDPDALFIFPDKVDTLGYIVTRANVLGITSALQIDRYRNTPIKYKNEHGVVRMPKLNGRVIFDMIAAILKKNPPIEIVNLYEISSMGQIRRKPIKMADYMTDEDTPNRVIKSDCGAIHRMIFQDTDLMISMESDMNMLMEFSNISRVSDCDLTDTVSRGEQIRVFTRLCHFFIDEGFYLNKEKLASKPLRFSIIDHPPTFPDPGELKRNIDLRKRCIDDLQDLKDYYKIPEQLREQGVTKLHRVKKTKKRKAGDKQVNMFSTEDESDDEEEAEGEKEGGSVLRPSPKFWGRDDRIDPKCPRMIRLKLDGRVYYIAVLDFASLYPTIMRSCNISYENVVYDKEYLDLEGVNYLALPVNADEIVYVADIDGTMPKLLKLVGDARKRIKKEKTKAKDAGDMFMASVHDMAQLSMKVFNNATYGFVGAEVGALLPMKEMMYMVTGNGRYLQKESARYVGEEYGRKFINDDGEEDVEGGMDTIYGDTDSIFVKVDLAHDTLDGICVAAGKEYRMDGFLGEGKAFTWDNLVVWWKNQRKPKDITVMERQHQEQAIVYAICHKVCKDLTNHFRDPVEMEFENNSTEVWLDEKKKSYYYNFWEEEDPSKIQKMKTTGMAYKKRDWTLWTRFMLGTVMGYINKNTREKIIPFLNEESQKFADGETPLHMLRLTKSFKGHEKYKHFRSVHLQVLLKMEEKRRAPLPANIRIPFLIVKGSEVLYLRGETPETVIEQGLEVDLEHYYTKQFYKPMKKLLQFFPHEIDFETIFNKYLGIIRCGKATSMFGDKSQHIQKVKKVAPRLVRGDAKRTRTNDAMSMFGAM